MNAELACVAHVAGLVSLGLVHGVVPEVGHHLVDDGNASQPSGKNSGRAGEVNLVIGLGAHPAHVSDVVLGSEVRCDHSRVTEQRAGIGNTERRFESSEDANVVEPCAIEQSRSLVERGKGLDFGNDHGHGLRCDTFHHIVLEPFRGNGVDANDYLTSRCCELGDGGSRDRSCLRLCVGWDSVFAVDEQHVGATTGQLGQEVRADRRSDEHRPHAGHWSEGHPPIVPDPATRHEYLRRMTERNAQPADSSTAGHALVTGASSGIGAATVRLLCAAGWTVTAAARRVDRLLRLSADTGCLTEVLDVTDRAGVAALVQPAAFDLVVNNAGLGRAMGAIWEATDDDIDRTIDTNVTGVINVVRAVVPGMIERQRGHIINMSSVLALYPGPAALYGATKGAVRLLSQDLRHELQGTGIRVTEICPGRVSTEFYDVALDDPAAVARAKDTGIQEVQPEDVAQAVLYAASAPWRVNVSTIEITPTEQTYGGAQFSPVS